MISPDTEAALDLWWQYYRGGLAKARHLPYAGGHAEQPAILMDALAIMGWAAMKIGMKIRDEGSD